MVSMGRALMARPKLLLLDEPSLGLAPMMVREIARAITAINADDGVSVILVEQNSRMALKISHRAYVLETGSVAIAGPSDELMGNDHVRKGSISAGDRQTLPNHDLGGTMRIKIINPTTTESFTRKNYEAGCMVAAAGTDVISTAVESGPVSIEGHYDEAASVIGILEEIHKGECEGIDGYVIACFGDPGVLAAREAARGPVIGIAEAAMHVASIVATGFSVVTTLARTKIITEHLVRIHGFEGQCRRIRATDLEVLALEDTGSDAYRIIVEECQSRFGRRRIRRYCPGMRRYD